MKYTHYIKRKIGNAILKYDFLYDVLHIFYKKLSKYSIFSLYEYSVNASAIIKMIDASESFNYYSQATTKELYEIWSYSKTENRKCSKQYIALLRNVTVRSDTDGIFCDGYYLTDKILFDRKGFEEHFPRGGIVKNDKCIIINRNKKGEKIPQAISLVKMWSYNYFHFVFEGMSRLGEIDKLEEYKSWPILIDECVKKDQRNVEIINILNRNHREIIWVKEGECIEVAKLLQPPTLSWGIWDVEKAVKNAWGYMIDIKAGQYLRNTILENYVPSNYYNCVFVARGNNNRLINEPELISFFEKNGFYIFCPDKIKSFQEELDCFATANCIVSCAGGASTNFIFCKETVDIYCLLPFEFRCDNPQDITNSIGVVSHMIDGKIVANGGMLMKSTFEISLEKCQMIVDKCYEKGYLS